MRVAFAITMLTACGRFGFDAGSSTIDAATADGADDDVMIDTPAAPAATVAFVSQTQSNANSATYMFSNQSIGPASADRIIVVCAELGGGAITPITSITLDGGQLGLVAAITDGISGSLAIGYGRVPMGTAAAIGVTSTAAGRAAIEIYRVTASNDVPFASNTILDPNADTAGLTGSVDTLANGIVVACAGYGSNNTNWTWSGSLAFTEAVDMTWAGEQGSFSSAFATAPSGGAHTITATPSAATPKLASIASWR